MKHSVEQTVRYVETDRMQVVHHSTYLVWFEIGRTSLLAAAGFPYRELERSGTLFPVVEYTCRMTGSLDYGDTVRIDTRVKSLRSRAVVFEYEVYRQDERVAVGTTSHVGASRELRPKRIAAPLLDALKPFLKK